MFSPSAVVLSRCPEGFPEVMPGTKEQVKKLTGDQRYWYRQYLVTQSNEFPENNVVKARLSLLDPEMV